jgi:hypothetical protein
VVMLTSSSRVSFETNFLARVTDLAQSPSPETSLEGTTGEEGDGRQVAFVEGMRF